MFLSKHVVPHGGTLCSRGDSGLYPPQLRWISNRSQRADPLKNGPAEPMTESEARHEAAQVMHAARCTTSLACPEQGTCQRTFKKNRYQLTYQDFFHYSVPVEAELDILDEKISQLVKLCHRLRTDNQELRQQLAGAQSANKQLTEKIAAARTRLETLLTRLPEEGE